MTSTVICDYTSANWEVNSLNQNACQVYAELQGVCNPSFTIASAISTSPPYLPQNNACGCNVVAYNLMAGCGWCQSTILTTWWLTEAQWAGNCTTTTFDASGIPPTVSITGITLPAWALIIPTGTTWDPSQAQAAAAAASPSNTLATSVPTFPSFTTAGTSTTHTFATAAIPTSTYTFIPAGYYSTGDGTTVGIAVGVTFGFYALFIIAIVVVYFVRQKKRQAWYGPMAQYYAGMRNGGTTQPLVYHPERPYEAVKTPMTSSSGGAGYTNYQPPPPEQPTVGYGYGPNTNSVYGAPNTNSMYGAPPAPPGAAPSVPAGYKGYAEAH